MQAKLLHSRLTTYCILFLLYLSGPLFLMTTNPESLPLPLLVLPFIWLFSVLFVTTRLVLRLKTAANSKQTIIVAVTVASLPVLLAVFQSIHQLSIKDVLLSVALVVVAAIYMLRADFIK